MNVTTSSLQLNFVVQSSQPLPMMHAPPGDGLYVLPDRFRPSCFPEVP